MVTHTLRALSNGRFNADRRTQEHIEAHVQRDMASTCAAELAGATHRVFLCAGSYKSEYLVDRVQNDTEPRRHL